MNRRDATTLAGPRRCPAPCVACGDDTAPRQVYCNSCRRALHAHGVGQGVHSWVALMREPKPPPLRAELRQAVKRR